MSYPWIKDSQFGTTPSVTDYLEVTSPNGLYLNSANENLTISKSEIDFNISGNSTVLIDNTHIHLNEQTPTTTPFTTDITHQNIILQSRNFITSDTQTLTLQPNLIQLITPNTSMYMGSGACEVSSTANYKSSLTPYECRLGFNGSTNQGKLFCLDIDCANNLNVVTINGLSPTSIGLVWSDFANPYSSLPSQRYYLTDNTYESYQDKEQFFARYQVTNQQASYSWSGINSQYGPFNIQANGYDINLNCSTLYINGTPYSGGGGGGNQDLSSVLYNGPDAYTSIRMNGNNIESVNNINLSTINNQPYPPYPTSPYGLPNVLAIDSNAQGASITNLSNIDVSTINGSSYPPSISIPQTAYSMPFQSKDISNNNQVIFDSGVSITGGYSYSVVWTFWYDGLVHRGESPEMIQGYSDLYSSASGSVNGSARQSGYWASATISSNSLYRTTITYTDNYYISSTDTYYPNVLQLNNIGWDGKTFVSAVITRTS